MNYFNESSSYETEVKKNFDKTNISSGAASGTGMDMGMNSCCGGMMMGDTYSMGGMCGAPIYECPQERVCHRYICHEVPHIMPCNTRIVNHHVFRHTYTPQYSCCEENVCENIYDRCC